jgi:hypothetical protein
MPTPHNAATRERAAVPLQFTLPYADCRQTSYPYYVNAAHLRALWCAAVKRLRRRPRPLPRSLNVRPKDWAPLQLKPIDPDSPFAAGLRRDYEREKRREAARRERSQVRQESARQDNIFTAAQLKELHRRSEYALILPTAKRIVRSGMRDLSNNGWAINVKGSVRVLTIPRALEQADRDSLLLIGMETARHAIPRFDGRGNVVGYLSSCVWYAFAQELAVWRLDLTIGLTHVPIRPDGRKIKIEVERLSHAPPGPYNDVGDEPAPLIDSLTYASSPWSEADDDITRRIFEGLDPARQGTAYSMSRAKLRTLLEDAISGIQMRELRVLLRFLLDRGYDFTNRSAYILQEYGEDHGLTQPAVRARRDRALAALLEQMTRRWPEWRQHFHTRGRKN